MNISQVVEAGLKLLLNQGQSKCVKPETVWETDEYKKAMAYLDTLADGSGMPVPPNDDGRIARTDKYKL